MKNLLLLLLVLGSFTVNAQQQTKEQAIAFINQNLNEANDLELYTTLKFFNSINKSAKFSLDTGKIVAFNYTKEMTYDNKKNIIITKLSFNPADIEVIVLISKKPNKAGMGELSVGLNENGVKAESTLNGVVQESSISNGFSVNFRQKNKKVFNELEKAFLRLRDLSK